MQNFVDMAIPLKQGLKLFIFNRIEFQMIFVDMAIPLKQGLKPSSSHFGLI